MVSGYRRRKRFERLKTEYNRLYDVLAQCGEEQEAADLEVEVWDCNMKWNGIAWVNMKGETVQGVTLPVGQAQHVSPFVTLLTAAAYSHDKLV